MRRRARRWSGRLRWRRAIRLRTIIWARCRPGLIEQAEHQLRLAIRADPNVAASHNELGRVLLRRGARHEAEASFRRAIALDRTLPFSHANLALALGAQGRAGEAAAAARAALAAIGGIETTVREDNLDLFDLIAMALDDADETADAVALFKAIVAFKNERSGRSVRHGARVTGSLRRAWRRKHVGSAKSKGRSKRVWRGDCCRSLARAPRSSSRQRYGAHGGSRTRFHAR